MPPSGYSASQSSSLADFLASCSYALEEEGRSKNWTPTQALENECAGIERVLSDSSMNPFAKQVLELTHLFYSSILKQQPKDFHDLRSYVTDVLDEFSKAVLAVHVPPLETESVYR
jgi:hypothetical protein